MLAGGVVDQHHRELEFSGLVHCLQAQDPCGGLLASSDHIRNQFRVILVNHADKIPAVVDDYVRTGLDYLADAPFIFIRSGSMDGEDIESFVDKGCRHIILG